MGWLVGVTFSFREVVGFIAEGEDLESPFVGGGTGRERKGLGGKREGFLFRFLLSSCPPSFPPFLLDMTEYLNVLFLFFISFCLFFRLREEMHQRVRGTWTLHSTTARPTTSEFYGLHFTSCTSRSPIYSFIHLFMSFIFVYEESCTEVYVMFEARLYGHHWVCVKERAWDWYWEWGEGARRVVVG